MNIQLFSYYCPVVLKMSWEWLTYAYGLHWILIFWIYYCVFRNWNYFSRQNVKFLRGCPFLGVHYKVLLGVEPLMTAYRKMYEAFPNNRFCGVFELLGSPFYVIRDPELAKRISIKDFEYFVNHTHDVHEDSDPILARTVFSMKDQKWKDMRSSMSPAFTGSRMRLMFQLILDVTNRFTNYMDKVVRNGQTVFEMKELLCRLSCDAIGTCAFGVQSNSIEDKNNEFFKNGDSITQHGIKFFIYSNIPTIMNFFKVRILREDETEFLRNIVKRNMKIREKETVRRNDMIDILIDAKMGNLKYVANEKYDNLGIATVEESSWNDSDTKGEISNFCRKTIFLMNLILSIFIEKKFINQLNFLIIF